jgi:hypothetical protein
MGGTDFSLTYFIMFGNSVLIPGLLEEFLLEILKRDLFSSCVAIIT